MATTRRPPAPDVSRIQSADPVVNRIQDGIRDTLSRALVPSAWVDLPMGPKLYFWGGATHPRAQARLLPGGVVEVRGMLGWSSDAVARDLIVTLPVGMRPALNRIVPLAGGVVGMHATVYQDGEVRLYPSNGHPTAGLWTSIANCGGFSVY